jgi:hypothetical protein
MILLFNLNTYIGGGETLLIRLAQYLRASGHPYQIMTSGGDCWILKEANRLKLNCAIWPSNKDSVNYQTTAERDSVVETMSVMFGNSKDLRIFTFCMRDLYNALYVFTRIPDVEAFFAHGIYHPEDVFYQSSLSVRPENIIANNRNLAWRLFKSNSILFVNNNGLKVSLGLDAPYQSELLNAASFAPLPIPVGREIPGRKLDRMRPLRIICISRFVVFKVAAILAIMRYAGNRPGVELLVIGHGPLKFILTGWMKIHRIRNIVITTGVAPNELDAYIDTCDLGYAQGTSILEIAKRGVPVLIAPYSRLRDLFNSRFPTLGIFGDVRDSSAFGDISDLSGEKTYAISDCVATVCGDYGRYQQQTIEFVRTFSSDVVCASIVKFILGAKFSNQQPPFEPMQAPMIKRLLKNLLGLGR